MMDSFLFAVLIMIATCCFTTISESNKEASEGAAREHLSYDKDSEILTLMSLSSENANVIKLEKVTINTYKYNPAELVYTGATVGGVHMGGIVHRKHLPCAHLFALP